MGGRAGTGKQDGEGAGDGNLSIPSVVSCATYHMVARLREVNGWCGVSGVGEVCVLRGAGLQYCGVEV